MSVRKGRTFIHTLNNKGKIIKFHRGIFKQNDEKTEGYIIWNGVANGSRKNQIHVDNHECFPKVIYIENKWWLTCASKRCEYHSCFPPKRGLPSKHRILIMNDPFHVLAYLCAKILQK
jgi:hypothetical protein